MPFPRSLVLQCSFWFVASLLASSAEALEEPAVPRPPEEPSALEMEIDRLTPAAVEMDEMVVTATRRRNRGFDVPLPLNVIGPGDLKRSIPVSMADLFRAEPGVDVSSTGPGSVRPMIRGLFDERVLILLDGVRLSEQRPGGNHILSLDPAQISRVEIVRGPASVLYGSDAIGGVMNVFTRGADRETGEALRIHASQRIEYESASDGWRSVTHVKGGRERVNLFLGGFSKDTGNLETPRGELPHSFYEGETVWLGGNYIGDDFMFRLRFWTMRADIGIPAPPAFEEDCFKDERHHMLTSRFEGDCFGGTLSADFGFQRHERHRYRRQTSPNPAVILGDLEVRIDVDVDTWSFDPTWVVVLGENHVLTVGLNAFHESADSGRTIEDTGSAWVNPMFHEVPVIPDSSRLGLGVFAQDEISFGERWLVTPGARLDRIRSKSDGHPRHRVDGSTSATDRAVSGNLGILHRLDETVNLTANLGRAFRAPTLLERYFDGPHDVGSDIGNPDLDPETSWNFDLGVKLQSERASAFASAFYNRIKDFIVKVPVPGTSDFQWRNVTDVSLRGLELGGDVEVGEGFSLFGTLAYVRGEDEDENRPLPSIPPLKARYGVRYERDAGSGHRFWAELAGTSAARQSREAEGEKDTAGWSRFDLRVGYDVGDRLSLVLAAENLGDKIYHDHLSRAWQAFDLDDQAGLNLKLAIEVRF